ncbi:Alpha/Beta hydrolase protein [Mucidula mucida]|nr:Alpha/Beta hydrolase protein [Mucidula mucida]
MIVISCPTGHPTHKEEHYDNQDACCKELKRLEALVEHYSHPGIAPPSARMTPSLKINEQPQWKSWHAYKYAFFVASKVTQMTGDALAHTIWGPRKKSWGIQMTLMSSLMRGAGKHTELMDVPSIRTFMGMGGFGPPPADALVTPVTFQVKRRRLRGILESLDAQETGTRELSGEWLVGKRTWQRLQTEWKAAQVGQRTHNPHKPTERVILYIHGGAYYVGSAEEKRIISVPLAQYTDARVFSLNYRLAPECTFPGPLHDAVSAYFRLTEDLHIPPENILVSGDSAGGGLALALLMYLRDNHYPVPAGGILMSPWVDMTMSGASWDSNAAYDVIPVFSPDDHMNPIANYLGSGMEKYLMHPYASPIFGDFKDLPPLLIQSGDSEVLQDEITMLANKAELAGVKVRHEEYEDGVHVFQTFPFLKIWHVAFMSMRTFVLDTLPQLQRGITLVFPETAERFMETEMDSDASLAVSADGRIASAGVKGLEEDSEDHSTLYESDDDHCTGCGHGKTWSLEQHHPDEPKVKISVIPPSSPSTPPHEAALLEKGMKRVSISSRSSSRSRSRSRGRPIFSEKPVPAAPHASDVDTAWQFWAS